MTFDSTINAGNWITIGVLVIGLAANWARREASLNSVAEKLSEFNHVQEKRHESIQTSL